MLTLGVRVHDVATQVSLEELIEGIHKTELHFIQFALGISFPQWSSEEVISPGLSSQIQREFENAGISIAILSCYINLIHPDEVERRVALNKFKAYLRYASSFGAKIVATETGGVDAEIHYTEANYTEAAYQKVVASVKEMATAAEKHGVLVGIEPGINHPIYNLDLTERLLKDVQSDNLGIILDPTNLIRWNTTDQYNQIIEEAFQRFGSKIVAIHLKDFEVANQLVVPTAIGKGQMPLRATIQQLSQLKPGIFTIFEETQGAAISPALRQVTDALK